MPGFYIVDKRCGPGEFVPIEGTVPPNDVETARRYRYRFESLEPLDKNNLLLFAYKATRPNIEIEQITIHNGQDEIYRPGKVKWLPIDITFYERVYGEMDSGTNSGGYDQPAELIYQWWAESVIIINTSLQGPLWDYATPPPTINGPRVIERHGKNYRKACQLEMLEGSGAAIWTYYLVNCWPMKITPCELGYADTEIADITITLAYDKAIEKRDFLAK